MPTFFAAVAFALSLVTPAPTPRADFHDAMRKLWEDHVTWTRLYIVSAAAGLPDAQPAAQRLLQNQTDIGNAIKPFYGDAAGERLTALLRQHILTAADLVAAAKAGNNDGVTAVEKTWHENGDQIAAFLSSANPNWPRVAMSDMLSEHLDYTTTEVVSRLKGDWAADIAAYDKGHEHMLMFSDMLADGIVKQFPAKFSK